ncbi:MAG: hypothetical protein VX519_12935 [Myxococcota bacterium]|nr:hypothetical protein [Myxococcota bacterium]
MPVITADILITGIRRDPIMHWLEKPENQSRILESAFDRVIPTNPGSWEVSFSAGPLSRSMGYEFLTVDDAHGGRRVRFKTTGRRTQGSLTFSLRTVKPPSNTMVTLHHDYTPGRVIGAVLDVALARTALEESWKRVLENLRREVEQDAPQG